MCVCLCSAPLAPNSPLRAELVLKTPSAATGSGRKKEAAKARGGELTAPAGLPSSLKLSATSPTGRAIVDGPLTFKSKVKSSGYMEAPR